MSTHTVSDTLGDLRRVWREEISHNSDDMSRRSAIRRVARAILDLDPVILDTETTGLSSEDEIVEIAILETCGNTPLYSLVRPMRPIPQEATDIHGIVGYEVFDSPTIDDLERYIIEALSGGLVAAYNGGFDVRLINQSFKARGMNTRIGQSNASNPVNERAALCKADGSVESITVGTFCVMRMYAAWVGEWNAYYGNYAWHPLSRAIEQCGLSFDGEAHGALVDAKATLALLEFMATV